MSANTPAIKKLQSDITGEVILPGDSGYDQASTILITKGAPAVIVRPRTAADVVHAVSFARKEGLAVSVRCGGHSQAGLSTNIGGLVIDLTLMNNIEVLDKQQRTVRIGGGALWMDIAKELQRHGLALSSGDTKTVGVGGLTLVGGIGWMVRKYGLALDSLVAAEVVTADGATLRASEEEHSDLFWALRGGGGNFGVVTSFEFVAHPCRKVFAGSITYGFDNLAAILKGWRDYMRIAPEELTTTVVVMPTHPAFGNMPPRVIVLCCYAGDDKQAAMSAIDPLLHLDTVVQQDIQEKEYADVLEDAPPPGDAKIVVNNTFMQQFTDEAIDAIADSPGQILQIRSVGGAMNRVPPDATAFAHRNSEVFIVSPLILDPDVSDENVQAALEPWRTLASSGQGAYVNFFSEATDTEVAAGYPPATYDRLASIKKRYDPQNVFNKNYNIKPAK
jgi:FAD/FMN-containing dehydrogenase